MNLRNKITLFFIFALTALLYHPLSAQNGTELTNESTAIQFEVSGIDGELEGQAGGYTFSGPITAEEIHLTGTTSFTLEENYSTRAGMGAYIEGSLGCAGRVQYDWIPPEIDEDGYITPPVGSGSETYEGTFDLTLAIPPDCDVIGAVYVNNCNNWNVCGGMELTINGKANPTENAQVSNWGLIYIIGVTIVLALIVIVTIIAWRKA